MEVHWASKCIRMDIDRVDIGMDCSAMSGGMVYRLGMHHRLVDCGIRHHDSVFIIFCSETSQVR